MAAPTMTLNQSLLPSAAQAAGATRTANLNLTTKVGATLQLTAAFGGTVTAGSVVELLAFRAINSTASPTPDTTAAQALTIGAVASSTARRSLNLGPGVWVIQVVNGDSTNSLVSSEVKYATIDAVA